ncbi:MAG: M14 family zinc carboxypeptidase, partial [Bacteroidota bacterium]
MKTLSRFILLSFIIGLLSYHGYAQKQEINEVLETRGEAVLVIKCKDTEKLSGISKIASITEFNSEGVIAYISRKHFQSLKAMEVEFRLYKPYYDKRRALNMAATISEMADWNKYPTWSVFQNMMISYAEDYPDICKLDTIGYSVEGRAMLVVKVSDNVDVDEPEPEFFLTGQMHGDELVSYMLPLRMIDYLLSNYGSDDRVDSIINNMEIW